MLIRLPWKFYLDHFERGLPTPDDVKSTKAHVFIRADDPHIESLRADAEFYCDRFGPDLISTALRNSARATLQAINEATK